MLYKKYIDQFTVSDETKSTLLNNVLQLASEPQTATKRASDKSAKIAKPKKQNTFKLHPKRWAIILVSVFIVIALVPTLYFTVPRGTVKNLVLNYMTNLMVDMDGVTAFGIRREQTSQNAASSYSADASGWGDFLNFGNYVAYAEEPAYKNYLYKTSETYETGNVEYEDGAITRVTFKKNTTKTEEVYDENGKLIDSNTELTQDEISGQINKIYVGENFTYMQFIIPVTESGEYYYYNDGLRQGGEDVQVRPDSLTYDEYGVADFDKGIYWSTRFTQSFVIDNNTGYIYKIEGMAILEVISDDCVVAAEQYTYSPDKYGRFQYFFDEYSKAYYRLSVNDDGTLSFTDVLPNKTVNTFSAMMDKYGWLYISTDTLNEVDQQNKVIFTTGLNQYLISYDKRVFTWDYNKIKCEVIDGVETPVPNDLTVFNLHRWGNNEYDSSSIWGYYKGHVMWTDYSHYNLGIDNYISFATNVGELYWYDETTVVSMKDNQVRYITLDLDACLENPRLYIPLSEFTLVEADGEGMSTGEWRYADSYYLQIGNDKMFVNNVYYKITQTGNVYYQLVKEDGKLQLVKLSDKSYTTNTFILQPINK